MPLKKEYKRASDPTDSGCDTLDSSSSALTLNDEEDEAQDKWLQSLGVENSEIRKINSSQVDAALPDVYSTFIFYNVFIVIGENDFREGKRNG